MDTLDSHVASPAGTRVNTIVLAFTLVAGMVVFLRIFSRLVLTRLVGFEDACIVIAMAFSISLTVMIAEQAMHGLGTNSSQLTRNERFTFLKAFWASLWLYNLALTATKVSILIQYLRIFPVRRFRKACFLVLGITIAYGAWACIGNVLLCNPVAFFWDKSILDGHCMDRMVIWFTNAGVSIAQDITILLLPMPVIQTLQIPTGQKKGLVIMFALGASATLVSIIRMYALDEVVRSENLPFDNPTHATLSAVEVNTGIVCACLPAMRPLFALMMPKYFSAAPQYTNVPLAFDLEQPAKKLHTPSHSTPTGSTRLNKTGTSSPGAATPQAPKPILSRTMSGRFSVTPNNSRPHTPGQLSHYQHSRSGSNASMNSRATASTPRPTGPRFKGNLNPLRLSPITPFSPPDPFGFPFPSSNLGSHSRTPSNTSHVLSSTPEERPLTPSSLKPLPVTPFPVRTSS